MVLILGHVCYLMFTGSMLGTNFSRKLCKVFSYFSQKKGLTCHANLFLNI